MVRNLLTHSAGLVEDNPWGDRQQPLPEADFTALLRAGVPFSRAPGLRMEYANLGYATLGRIVGNVSGERYQDYIRDTVMRPLGMNSTTYDFAAADPARRVTGCGWQDNRWLREPDMADGAFGAMGGVVTSANDYSKWVGFLLSAWPARDGPDAGPVRRSTVREIVTGANFAEGYPRNPDAGGAPCRQPFGRLSWLRIECPPTPRQERWHFCVRQQDLRHRFIARAARGARAGEGRRPSGPTAAGRARSCNGVRGGARSLADRRHRRRAPCRQHAARPRSG